MKGELQHGSPVEVSPLGAGPSAAGVTQTGSFRVSAAKSARARTSASSDDSYSPRVVLRPSASSSKKLGADFRPVLFEPLAVHLGGFESHDALRRPGQLVELSGSETGSTAKPAVRRRSRGLAESALHFGIQATVNRPGRSRQPIRGRSRPSRLTHGAPQERHVVDRRGEQPDLVESRGEGQDASVGSRPKEGLSPTTPQNDAGRMTDPCVWLPNANGIILSATAAAEPLDEPPRRVLCIVGIPGRPGVKVSKRRGMRLAENVGSRFSKLSHQGRVFYGDPPSIER